MFKNLLFIFLYNYIIALSSEQSLTVETNSGPLRGKLYENRSKFNKRSINAFIGIPYANPPVGVNRFKPPRPVGVWTTEKDVTNNRVMCPQVYQRFDFQLNQTIREDEDCLYLNIFVPLGTQPVSGYPVMFYIHGGQFQFGGKDFYPPDYLLDNDIILVTINYRLGVLGFLSTGDDISVGNFGIRDQILALKWISSNINFFGGNPQNITIFGHDSGAISASLLLVISETWGLFHNVMILSGSMFSPNALKYPNPKTGLDFGEALNCDLKFSVLDQYIYNTTVKLVECLRTKSVEELMSGSRIPGLYPNTFLYNFGPVIDSNVSSPLLVDHPIRLLQSGNYWKTPLVSGLTLNEGSLEYFTEYDRIREWTLTEKIHYLFGRYDSNEFYSKVLMQSVEWYYFKRFNDTYNIYNTLDNRINTNINRNNIFQQNKDLIIREKEEQILIEAIGDLLYGSANSLLLDLHSKNSKLAYLYVLEHRGLKTFGTLQKNGSQIIHRNQYGVTHMDDIFYLFPTLYSDNITSTYDERIIRTMCQYFAYFAQYGVFGQNNNLINYQTFGTYWTPYSPLNPYYMRFLSQNSQIGRGFRTEYLTFWNYFVRQIFDDIYNQNVDENQLSAQFIGTVQLRGMIRFGNNKFVIS